MKKIREVWEFQVYAIWDDWALPLRVNVEVVNHMVELHVFAWHLVVYQRPIYE